MSSKVVLVLGTNIHWAPFYYRYENILREEGIKFDLIIWNREKIQEKNFAEKVYEYTQLDKANNKNPLKFFKFFGFSNFFKKVILKNKYEKIIFVGTYGCAPVICSNFLSKNYKNKIWIDIRDDLYEWFKPYYSAQSKVIKASYATAISSHKYKVFLPNHKYYYMHNIDPKADYLRQKYKHKSDSKIRISFIGNIRYYEQNIKILRLLKNDNRFKIQYFGAGSDKLKKYCAENEIKNVEFYGRFSQEDTIKFYEKTDIINNVYGNDSLNLQTALSNKLYYGLLFELPIMVSSNTYMEELVKKYNIGYVFNDNENFGDDLYNWYLDKENKKILPNYDFLWDKFYNEDKDCINKLKKFIKER